MMVNVIVYTATYCPYCVKAKKLLEKKGVSFQEIDVTSEADRSAMIEKAGGRRTVPQIFIDDVHIGGCDDLYALDSEGKLDGMLSLKS